MQDGALAVAGVVSVLSFDGFEAIRAWFTTVPWENMCPFFLTFWEF